MSRFHDFSNEVDRLINLIKSQFISRTIIEGNASGKDFKNVEMTSSIKDNILWLTIKTDEELHNITIPVPYTKNNITYIKLNEVKRIVCNHLDVPNDRIITYLDAIQRVFIGDYSGLVTTVPLKKTILIQSLAYSILNNNMSIIVYNIQKAINELVNKMPLHETAMNSWMMNNRLILIDPEFDYAEKPAERLEYQIQKNIRYHDRGWTSIGLSDGSLADKNYILTQDIRKYTAFGLRHHNPQRNLYSTLGMKGDELPQIRSESAHKLIKQGITRKGWNWFTAFVDIPDTFEDQIVIDKSHANKFIYNERRLQCFGEVLVKENQIIKFGTTIAVAPDGESEVYKIRADKSWVKKIVKSEVSIGGNKKEVYNIIVAFHRKLKDGTKITNTHGNKGVIRLFNLGYAIDPKTGKKRKIDVIVSAKTSKKRKNNGQVLEAITNDLYERRTKVLPQLETQSVWTTKGVGVVGSSIQKKRKLQPLVLHDDYTITETDMIKIKNELKSYGFDKTCTWKCSTYVGEVTAICGEVFWGVSKDVEDQLWENGTTERTNGKDLRTAGLKFSSIEFKAIETRFGENNAIIDEILSYTQGIENLNESVQILKSKMYKFPENKQIRTVLEVNEVDQSNGTIFSKKALSNTVADEYYLPEGFILQLPVFYQTAVGNKSIDTYEGAVVFKLENMNWSKYRAMYLTDKIYVPAGVLRRSWRHNSGLYGMSEHAVLLNNIISFSKRYINEPNKQHHFTSLHMAIGTYFMRTAISISTKKGDISNYAMSVRYPYSAKAVATLSNKLPPNTIQIHKNMADNLNVVTGDIVLTERFPCLGFRGVRPQQVYVTNDPLCKYTIRVSGNSLVSQNLDFDGDVLYVASFHTKEAKEVLRKEWENPNEDCWKHIHKLNVRKGEPTINCLNINDYDISPVDDLTEVTQSEIVGKLTGVKAQTGPVISMAYNLMRIIENSGIKLNRSVRAEIEMFVEKASQSVFEQKHGLESLHDIVIDAICTGNSDVLAEEGFNKEISEFICNVIRTKASNLGIRDLVNFHEKVGKNGSNVLNKIIRKENKLYFASRSSLESCDLLEYMTSEVVDLPSKIYSLTMSGKYTNVETVLEIDKDEELLNKIKTLTLRNTCSKLFKCVDKIMGVIPKINENEKLLITS